MAVLFSEKSKLNLKDLEGIRRVRKPNEQRLNSKYCNGTLKHGGGKILLKCCFCFSEQGIGPEHKIDGIMDCFMYGDILKDMMLPNAEEDGPLKWTFQQRPKV